MKVVIESVGAVASRVQLGAHQLVFDQPSSVPGGQDQGPSPLDVMAAAVGACAHYFTAAFLYGRSLPTEGLRVEVDADKVREPSPRLGKVCLHILLPVGVPEHYLPAIERAVRNCPAYGTLLNGPELELIVSSQRSSMPAPAA